MTWQVPTSEQQQAFAPPPPNMRKVGGESQVENRAGLLPDLIQAYASWRVHASKSRRSRLWRWKDVTMNLRLPLWKCVALAQHMPSHRELLTHASQHVHLGEAHLLVNP